MSKKPLAYRMRPQTVEEIVGQSDILSEGSLLKRMIDTEVMSSIILYGPPGVGKTTIATVIAKKLRLPYRLINAVTHTKKDLDIVIQESKMHSTSYIVIIDEFHRLDKAKQDFLLPHLEDGQIICIGCTTSNPFHSINPAIRSRCQIFELKQVLPEDVKLALIRALSDEINGLKGFDAVVDDAALDFFSMYCNGDVRNAMNALELAVLSTPDKHVTIEVAKQCMQKKNFSHDQEESHYNVLSALQKSIRGSDVNAALHYLARLIEAGDLTSIGRRLLVIAYEDVGLANPAIGSRALAAIESAERVGFPEARIPLSVITIELALSPKSNSAYSALDAAIHDLHHARISDIPAHLKDAHYKGAADLGRGIGYQYPHDFPGGWVKQQYLPDSIKNKAYYEPKNTSKYEEQLAMILKKINTLS